MKRKSVIYGLLGAIGLVVGLSAINPAVSDKSKKNDKIAASVVSYGKIKKSDSLDTATGGALTATAQAIDSYATENVTSSERKKITRSRSRKAVVTPKPTATPNPREQIVKIAKSYKGRITYLWGGKPSDAQIAGKNQPKELDCSGFIQFVYSKYKKKRISELGSTIAIAGLPKIKKSELKIGDIGLRNGTGSIYFDADGKSYSEPQFAEEANDKKIEKFDKKTDTNKKKKSSAKIKIKNKTKKIEEIKEKREVLKKNKKEILSTDIDVDEPGDTDDDITDDEKQEAAEIKKDEQNKELEKNAAELKKCDVEIANIKSDIKKLSKNIKKYDKQIKKLKKIRKKYDTDIEKSIDHVGIYCGKNKAGKMVWCHCSSSKGGVVYEATDIFTHYYSSESCIAK